MELRPVGRSGLRVSNLGLGTAAWVAGGRSGSGSSSEWSAGSSSGSSGARRVDEDGATGLLRTFLGAGGTLVDVVAGSDAEAMLSRMLGSQRDDLVLAVRVPGAAGGASRQGLMTRLDASLRRIGTDHLDVWQVPVGGVGVPLDETLGAVDQAVASGRVRYAGVVDHVGWRLARAATWQQAWPGRAPIVCDHVEYSLLARDVEVDTAPAAVELGVGLFAYAPFGGGALVGREQGERMGVGAERVDRGDPRALGIIEAVATAADGLATTPVAVALSWLRGRPGVSSIVVGARTTAQLTAAVTAHELSLPDAIRSALDDVSTPDGAARGEATADGSAADRSAQTSRAHKRGPTTGAATTRASTTGAPTTGAPAPGTRTTGSPTSGPSTTGSPTSGPSTTGSPTAGPPPAGRPPPGPLR